MPAPLVQHFLCRPWHNTSGFRHSSALVCHRQVLPHSCKNWAMGTRENRDIPNLNPEAAMPWSWDVEIPASSPLNYPTLLPSIDKITSQLLTSLSPQPDTARSAWSQGEIPTWHPHPCRHASISSLQLYAKLTQILTTITCKDTNLMKNQENTVKLL